MSMPAVLQRRRPWGIIILLWNWSNSNVYLCNNYWCSSSINYSSNKLCYTWLLLKVVQYPLILLLQPHPRPGHPKNINDNNYSSKSLKLLEMGGETIAKTNEPSPNKDTVTTTAIRIVDRVTLTLETDLPSSSLQRKLSTGGMLQVTLWTSVMGRPSKATKVLLLESSSTSRLLKQPPATMTDNVTIMYFMDFVWLY